MNDRCPWCGDDPLYQHYHDHEWGVPEYDDQALFECLNLEGAQAGLSWITVLRKREHYRQVFDGFDAQKIARYDDRKVAALLQDPGIIRNRLKVAATIGNARSYLALREEGRTLSDFLWDSLPHTQGGARLHPGGRGHEQGPEKTGLQVCWPHHRLRLHAGYRHGQRPPHQLPAASGSHVTAKPLSAGGCCQSCFEAAVGT